MLGADCKQAGWHASMGTKQELLPTGPVHISLAAVRGSKNPAATRSRGPAHLRPVAAGVQPALKHAVRVRAGVSAAAHTRLWRGNGRKCQSAWCVWPASATGGSCPVQTAGSWGSAQGWFTQLGAPLSGTASLGAGPMQLQAAAMLASRPSPSRTWQYLAEIWAGCAAVAVAPGVPPLGLLPLQQASGSGSQAMQPQARCRRVAKSTAGPRRPETLHPCTHRVRKGARRPVMWPRPRALQHTRAKGTSSAARRAASKPTNAPAMR